MPPKGRPPTHYLPDLILDPASGVKSDFKKLINQFLETKQIRYEQFAYIWKNMRMSLIFSGRQTDQECREFVEECMPIALQYFLPPHDFQTRVAGLYLLYGLFLKQPFLPRVKIRVTLSQWKEVLAFHMDLRSQKHLDVEYVYHALQYYRAFYFVATPREMDPRSRDMPKNDNDVEKNQMVMERLLRQKSAVAEILEPDNIDQLSAIHDQYHRMKCVLGGPESTQPARSLDVIDSTLIQYITKTAAQHDEMRKLRAAGKRPSKKRNDSGHTTSESEGDSESDLGTPTKSKPGHSIGSRRAEIRAKALSLNPSSSRARRHREIKTIAVDDNIKSESSSSSPEKALRRLSMQASISPEPADEPAAATITVAEGESVVLSMPSFEELTGVPASPQKAKSPTKGKGKKRLGAAIPDTVTSPEPVASLTPAKKKKGRPRKSVAVEDGGDESILVNYDGAARSESSKVNGEGKGKTSKGRKPKNSKNMVVQWKFHDRDEGKNEGAVETGSSKGKGKGKGKMSKGKKPKNSKNMEIDS